MVALEMNQIDMAWNILNSMKKLIKRRSVSNFIERFLGSVNVILEPFSAFG